MQMVSLECEDPPFTTHLAERNVIMGRRTEPHVMLENFQGCGYRGRALTKYLIRGRGLLVWTKFLVFQVLGNLTLTHTLIT